MTSSDLAALTATEIVRRVSTGEDSPVEVVRAALDRVERFNPTLNAVVTLNDRALDDARALESSLSSGAKPGPLCGVPVGIKDVTPVAGLRPYTPVPLVLSLLNCPPYVMPESAVACPKTPMPLSLALLKEPPFVVPEVSVARPSTPTNNAVPDTPTPPGPVLSPCTPTPPSPVLSPCTAVPKNPALSPRTPTSPGPSVPPITAIPLVLCDLI